jgi:beta-phosphoglucomutase-like phosphatase (HAD superfamily)
LDTVDHPLVTLPVFPAQRPALLSAVIFDMDGLLLDTEAIFKLSWKYAAQVCGYDLPDEVFLRMIGRTRPESEEILREVFGHGCVPADFSKSCDAYHEKYVREHGIPLKTGVDAMLDWCDARHLPRAIATSTGWTTALTRLEQTGLRPRFGPVITGDRVSRGKPDPEIYSLAAAALGVTPQSCLALEDSYNGVRAAHAAGMTVYMVPDLLAPTAEMVRLANGIFPSLPAVLEYLEAPACAWREAEP